MESSKTNLNFRSLISQDPGTTCWITQCLDYDIAAYGKDPVESWKCFVATLFGYIEYAQKNGKTPFEDMERAPQWIWDEYEKAESLNEDIEIIIPEGFNVEMENTFCATVHHTLNAESLTLTGYNLQ